MSIAATHGKIMIPGNNKRKVLLILLFVLNNHFSFAQVGELSVITKEESTFKAIPFSTIKLYRNNLFVLESFADSSGTCVISNLIPDKYDVSCEEKFHDKVVKKGVLISAAKITFLDFTLKKKRGH